MFSRTPSKKKHAIGDHIIFFIVVVTYYLKLTLKISAPRKGAFDVFSPDVYNPFMMNNVFLVGPRFEKARNDHISFFSVCPGLPPVGDTENFRP